MPYKIGKKTKGWPILKMKKARGKSSLIQAPGKKQTQVSGQDMQENIILFGRILRFLKKY